MSRRPPTPVCSASPSPEVTPGCRRKIHSFGEPLKQLLWSPHLGKPTPLTGKGSSQDPGPGTLLGSQSLVPLAPAARVLVKKVQRGDMKSQRLRIQSPAPSLMAWLTLGKLPALPGPQFSNRKKKMGWMESVVDWTPASSQPTGCSCCPIAGPQPYFPTLPTLALLLEGGCFCQARGREGAGHAHR